VAAAALSGARTVPGATRTAGNAVELTLASDEGSDALGTAVAHLEPTLQQVPPSLRVDVFPTHATKAKLGASSNPLLDNISTKGRGEPIARCLESFEALVFGPATRTIYLLL
jgi:hypothetical protein